MTPTARCLADLRKSGYDAAVVEKWNAHAKIRHDLFGFGDVIYLCPSNIVLVQVTSGANHAARKAKILAEPRALRWIQAGGLLELWSYSKKGPRGKPKRWSCRREEIVESDFTS